MGYLIEIDPLSSLRRFPEPDASSPFHRHAPANPAALELETDTAEPPAMGGEQLELLPSCIKAEPPK